MTTRQPRRSAATSNALPTRIVPMPGGDLDRSRRPDGVHLSRPVAHEIGVWALAQLDARPDARLDRAR